MKKFNICVALFLSVMTGQHISAQVSNISGTTVRNANINLGLGAGIIVLKNLNTLDSLTLPLTSEFTFDNIPNGNDYELYILREPTNDDLNGVSTLDVVMILRHILGIAAFTEASNILAADTNNDGKITSFDLVVLRRLILGITTKLDVNFKIRAKNDIASETIVINDLSQDMTNQDFLIVKVGDVNGSQNN